MIHLPENSDLPTFNCTQKRGGKPFDVLKTDSTFLILFSYLMQSQLPLLMLKWELYFKILSGCLCKQASTAEDLTPYSRILGTVYFTPFAKSDAYIFFIYTQKQE
jgi:hypothetical protein